MTESPPEKNISRVYMGVDPASGGFAFTIIKGRVTGNKTRALFVESGKKEINGPLDTRQLLEYARQTHKVSRLGIEVPGQYAGASFESSYLISSALNIGMLIQVASELNIQVQLFPSQVVRKKQYGEGWRFYLFGRRRLKRTAWDAMVRDWLTNGGDVCIKSTDAPILNYPKRSSGDVRDSSAIAYSLYIADRNDDYKNLGCTLPYNYHNYIRSSR